MDLDLKYPFWHSSITLRTLPLGKFHPPPIRLRPMSPSTILRPAFANSPREVTFLSRANASAERLKSDLSNNRTHSQRSLETNQSVNRNREGICLRRDVGREGSTVHDNNKRKEQLLVPRARQIQPTKLVGLEI